LAALSGLMSGRLCVFTTVRSLCDCIWGFALGILRGDRGLFCALLGCVSITDLLGCSGLGISIQLSRFCSGLGITNLLGRLCSGLGISNLLGRLCSGLGITNLLGRFCSGLGISNLLGRLCSGLGISNQLGRLCSGLGISSLLGTGILFLRSCFSSQASSRGPARAGAAQWRRGRYRAAAVRLPGGCEWATGSGAGSEVAIATEGGPPGDEAHEGCGNKLGGVVGACQAKCHLANFIFQKSRSVPNPARAGGEVVVDVARLVSARHGRNRRVT
jgi:hypothetical protein